MLIYACDGCCLLQFLDQYVRLASGPLKWVKLVEFLKTTYPRIVNEMLARQEAQVRTYV
jgi:hypothetical protein